MTEYHYIVAGHGFTVEAADGIDLSGALAHYAPFTAETPAQPVFRLRVIPDETFPTPEGILEEFNQDDEGSQIRQCRTPEGDCWFEFSLWDKLAGRLLVPREGGAAILSGPGFTAKPRTPRSYPEFALNNALMVLYALATARKGTALFHAAVVGHAGAGYLFLGRSGTGKSTHARLWLKYVPDSELVNDDNPVVRVLDDGSVRVYGSPWSGKTPCYRNMDLPAGGFVQLAQAPYNAIRPLGGIQAYAALVPGISGMRWNRSLADGLHETENALVARVPVWHLDCLPDEAAARLCSETITRRDL